MSSKGTSFVGAELAHYEECMRTIPAILIARAQDRERDATMLFGVLTASAAERELLPAVAWGVFASAAMNWLTQAFTAHASAAHRDVVDLLRDAIAAAADWVDT